MQGEISQDIARDDNIPMSPNLMSFRNYRRFPQQEPANRNLIFQNYLNNFPKSLDRREVFPQAKPVKEYPRVVPSRQVFDRSENLFFRNPRNKYSESSSEDYKRTKNENEDPMSKLVAYRADRDTKPSWKNSRDTSFSNIIQSERPLPKVEDNYRSRREDIFDKERNVSKKSSNSVSQFAYPRERYNPIEFNPSELKHDPYVKDTDIPKSTKNFFDNWNIAKDSPQSSNLGQLGQNLLEVHSAKNQEIIAKDDNEQINSNFYHSKFPQDLNIWESKKDAKLFDSPMRTNTIPFENEEEDMKEYFEDETEHFMNEENMKEYFEDEAEQDTIETKRENYNPDVLPPNIWRGIEDEKLDDLDFMRENSQEFQNMEQLGLYSEGNNNEYFQDEQNKDVIFQDKAHGNAEAARAPVINAYNAYILPRYLNIVNDKKYPVKSEMQELSEAKNSIRANKGKEIDQRFFEDEAVIEDTRIRDFILPKNMFDIEEFSSPITDTRNNVRNKNEVLTELDPDLLDDIEDPPIATTESIPI